MLKFVNLLLTNCCHISGAIPLWFTVLTLYDCPIEANDRFMVLRSDVIRLFESFGPFMGSKGVESWKYGPYDMIYMFLKSFEPMNEPLWILLQNKLFELLHLILFINAIKLNNYFCSVFLFDAQSIGRWFWFFDRTRSVNQIKRIIL